MTGTTPATADPTDALPAGHDDPRSPWFIPPELRAHYVAPTVDELLAARDTVLVILPTDAPEPTTRRPMGEPPTPAELAETRQRDELRSDVRYSAHLTALHRARDARERAEQEHRWRGRRVAEHTCELCGATADDVTTRRLLDMAATAAYTAPVRLVARTCPPCGVTLALVALTRHADEPLPDGRTRRAAAAAWLAER